MGMILKKNIAFQNGYDVKLQWIRRQVSEWMLLRDLNLDPGLDQTTGKVLVSLELLMSHHQSSRTLGRDRAIHFGVLLALELAAMRQPIA